MWVVGLVLMELVFDLLQSCQHSGQPKLGSTLYSLKRLLKKDDADAMDLWELHKAAWARASIYPVEPKLAGRISTGRLFIETMASIACIVALFAWVNMPKEFFAWFLS